MADENFEDLIGQEEEVSEPVQEEQAEEVEAVGDEEQPQPEEAKAEEPDPALSETEGLKAALREERRKRQEMERAFTNREEPQKAPDVFEDPAGYQRHMESNFTRSMMQQKLETSRFLAEREFGANVVQEAFEYFNEHPEQSQALLKSPSPFHEAVSIYQQQKVAREVGNDPKAYKEKLRAEILAELEAEKTAKQIKSAPSMANETSIGGRTPPAPPSFTALDSILPD
ncbi:hypothetical protein [Salipiger thiooxidans]|uniref:hypothetical protein n=1 Tax=Salipiger thiooxidans TaxID=282683 RepID=UPI001CD7452F|nr:hypothetical protein [Salipiger thiooxidans]MCA0846113.1 hypothetical protein [Salipiger thiooxidans]